MTRANKQIWRLARWVYEEICMGVCDPNEQENLFEQLPNRDCNKMYDKAAELLKKIQNNDFTGGDNHRD